MLAWLGRYGPRIEQLRMRGPLRAPDLECMENLSVLVLDGEELVESLMSEADKLVTKHKRPDNLFAVPVPARQSLPNVSSLLLSDGAGSSSAAAGAGSSSSGSSSSPVLPKLHVSLSHLPHLQQLSLLAAPRRKEEIPKEDPRRRWPKIHPWDQFSSGSWQLVSNSLTSLSLSDNMLAYRDSGLFHITALTNLRHMGLQFYPLHGILVPSIVLERYGTSADESVHFNPLSLPPQFTGLTSLQLLGLSIPIKADTAPGFTELTSLMHLELSFSRPWVFADGAMLAPLTQLQHLSLGRPSASVVVYPCGLFDDTADSDYYGEPAHSHHFDLAGILPHLSNLQQLTELRFSNTRDGLGGYINSPHYAPYSAITSSSKLQALTLSNVNLPTAPGAVYEAVFPEHKQLQITRLDLNLQMEHGKGMRGTSRLSRIQQACPNLRELRLVAGVGGLPKGVRNSELSQFTALTHLAITLRDTASASNIAELTGLRSLYIKADEGGPSFTYRFHYDLRFPGMSMSDLRVCCEHLSALRQVNTLGVSIYFLDLPHAPLPLGQHHETVYEGDEVFHIFRRKVAPPFCTDVWTQLTAALDQVTPAYEQYLARHNELVTEKQAEEVMGTYHRVRVRMGMVQPSMMGIDHRVRVRMSHPVAASLPQALQVSFQAGIVSPHEDAAGTSDVDASMACSVHWTSAVAACPSSGYRPFGSASVPPRAFVPAGVVELGWSFNLVFVPAGIRRSVGCVAVVGAMAGEWPAAGWLSSVHMQRAAAQVTALVDTLQAGQFGATVQQWPGGICWLCCFCKVGSGDRCCRWHCASLAPCICVIRKNSCVINMFSCYLQCYNRLEVGRCKMH